MGRRAPNISEVGAAGGCGVVIHWLHTRLDSNDPVTGLFAYRLYPRKILTRLSTEHATGHAGVVPTVFLERGRTFIDYNAQTARVGPHPHSDTLLHLTHFSLGIWNMSSNTYLHGIPCIFEACNVVLTRRKER